MSPWSASGRSGRPSRPEDGALVRRHSRIRFDPEQQLEHTEDRYEVLRDDQVIAVESYSRSPATRWYTQEQVIALYRQAGFVDVRLFSGFTREPVQPHDDLFTAIGTR